MWTNPSQTIFSYITSSYVLVIKINAFFPYFFDGVDVDYSAIRLSYPQRFTQQPLIITLTDVIYGVCSLATKIDFEQTLHEKAINKFNELYSAIFGEISSMLRKAKLAPMIELQKHNPSFTETASQLKLYRDLSKVAADLIKIDQGSELAMLDEYISLVTNLAKAIDNDDYDALCGAISALDEKPYI